jgi:hypothetical protein
LVCKLGWFWLVGTGGPRCDNSIIIIIITIQLRAADQCSLCINQSTYVYSCHPPATALFCSIHFAGEKQVGVLDARSVVPVQGNVMVFPHGGTKGSLVHEGSAVVQVRGLSMVHS